MLKMDMGLSGGGAAYNGPIFSAASVPGSGGYPDTAPRASTLTELAFGPGASEPGGKPVHGLIFGLVCFGLLVAMWATLPK